MDERSRILERDACRGRRYALKLFFELDFGIQAVYIERNFVQLGQK